MVKDRSSKLVWRIVTLVILALVVVGIFYLVNSPKSRKVREANSENIFVVTEQWKEDKMNVKSNIVLSDFESIQSQMNGIVTAIFVKEKTWVKAGATVAKLADYSLKESLKMNTIELNKTQKLLNNPNNLDAQQLALLREKSQTLDNKIATLNRDIALCDLKTPVSGFISALYIKQGQNINRGHLVGKMGIANHLYIESTIENAAISNKQIDSLATLSHSASDSNYVVKIFKKESSELFTKIICEWKNPPSFLSLDHNINITFNVKSLQKPTINRNLIEVEDNQTYVTKLVHGEKNRMAAKFSTTDSINFTLTSNEIAIGDTLMYSISAQ